VDARTAWIDERLAAAGIRRTGPVEQSRVRPWGTVRTAPTDAGPVWMKATGPQSRHELGVYELLARVAPERVLAPLGSDAVRGWLLLPDGGPELRSRPDAFEQLIEALPHYGELQRLLAGHVPELLAAGVPDMRPARMPARFDEALAAVAEVVAHIGDDADRAALARVEQLRGRFGEWCEALSVPSSIDHNDLHPGNVLGCGSDPRFFDWGDAVVAHPMTSLYVPLRLADAGRRDVVRDTYLATFDDLAPRPRLVTELALACRVAIVARTLTWVRCVGTDGSDERFPRGPLDCLVELLDTGWIPLG
jgi:hypothetical protein